jgi:acetyl-CoA carboxylase carboxyltransferase component
MGPEAAVNAVYFNKIQALPEEERPAYVAQRQAEYNEDVDLMRVASELIIDGVVEPEDLRLEILERLAYAARKSRSFSDRRHGVPPV